MSICRNPRPGSSRQRTPRRIRHGAVLTFELVLIIPIVLALSLAVVELSMLWSGNQRLAMACRTGCRVATLPGSSDDEVRLAVWNSLGAHRLAGVAKVEIERGKNSGDPVGVRVSAPMRDAAPDLLAVVGFRLGDRRFSVVSIMRRE